MTFIGKLLSYLNLILGLGILAWSTSEFALRPGWFEPIPERIEKGNDPVNFAMIKDEAESLARSANLASGIWGDNLKTLQASEKRRNDRRKELDRRLAWTKKGNPGDKAGAAFYNPLYEKDEAGKDTSYLDLTALGQPVIGPDARPLRGVDTLMTGFTDDVKEVERLALLNAKHRDAVLDLNQKVLVDDARLAAMIAVREAVQAELFHLATFEVNVYETRATVFRRQRQLSQRLTELGGAN